MFDISSVWGAVAIIGPIILAIAIIWAMRHNKGTPAEERATEEATRRSYDEHNRTDTANER